MRKMEIIAKKYLSVIMILLMIGAGLFSFLFTGLPKAYADDPNSCFQYDIPESPAFPDFYTGKFSGFHEYGYAGFWNQSYPIPANENHKNVLLKKIPSDNPNTNKYRVEFPEKMTTYNPHYGIGLSNGAKIVGTVKFFHKGEVVEENGKNIAVINDTLAKDSYNGIDYTGEIDPNVNHPGDFILLQPRELDPEGKLRASLHGWEVSYDKSAYEKAKDPNSGLELSYTESNNFYADGKQTWLGDEKEGLLCFSDSLTTFYHWQNANQMVSPPYAVEFETDKKEEAKEGKYGYIIAGYKSFDRNTLFLKVDSLGEVPRGPMKLEDAKRLTVDYIRSLPNLSERQKARLINDVNSIPQKSVLFGDHENIALADPKDPLRNSVRNWAYRAKMHEDQMKALKAEYNRHCKVHQSTRYQEADNNLKTKYDEVLANVKSKIDATASGMDDIWEGYGNGSIGKLTRELENARIHLNGMKVVCRRYSEDEMKVMGKAEPGEKIVLRDGENFINKETGQVITPAMIEADPSLKDKVATAIANSKGIFKMILPTYHNDANEEVGEKTLMAHIYVDEDPTVVTLSYPGIDEMHQERQSIGRAFQTPALLPTERVEISLAHNFAGNKHISGTVSKNVEKVKVLINGQEQVGVILENGKYRLNLANPLASKDRILVEAYKGGVAVKSISARIK